MKSVKRIIAKPKLPKERLLYKKIKIFKSGTNK
jgi:hypothetical protein